ncbi:MAG: TerC family protein [Verrucomicrobia bacterium]|nr:TerC family protein [Verrucomicrobiota bacterium]
MEMDLIATGALLIGLEIVLGIDNILLISILTDRLPPDKRTKARYLGLGFALGARCVLLLGASYMVQLSKPVIAGLSWKSIILIGGGGFLLFKAVKEIHHVVESRLDEHGSPNAVRPTLSAIILQIILLDMVFSIDSVITAVGLTDNLIVIYTAVVVSFVVVLAFSGLIAGFVQRHPTLKILALSFLITIGITLVIEGFGAHVPKGYIYLPMGFALAVELIQMRFTHNQSKRETAPPKPTKASN